jgi:hypothetical protein
MITKLTGLVRDTREWKAMQRRANALPRDDRVGGALDRSAADKLARSPC